MMVSVRAPAKVNLCLHITGQRPDGYHLLDSLVSFGAAFDELTVSEAGSLTLKVDGPESQGVPADSTNLVIRAAELVANGRGAAFTLTKNLPAASGIGGGSADAAAAFRGALAHWGGDAIGQALPSEQRVIYDNLSSLGADIPMCLSSRPLRARGVGDEISFVDHLPDLPIVIVNPRIPVSTPEVFGRLKAKQNPPLPAVLPKWAGVRSFCEWLATTRNDLEEPAIALHPEIAGVLKVLSNVEKALFHRMSGSGATCFAIFDSADAATESMLKLKADFPNWWITGGWLCDCSAQLFVENP